MGLWDATKKLLEEPSYKNLKDFGKELVKSVEKIWNSAEPKTKPVQEIRTPEITTIVSDSNDQRLSKLQAEVATARKAAQQQAEELDKKFSTKSVAKPDTRTTFLEPEKKKTTKTISPPTSLPEQVASRGKHIKKLDHKSAELSNAAQEFSELAKQLAAQSKGKTPKHTQQLENKQNAKGKDNNKGMSFFS